MTSAPTVAVLDRVVNRGTAVAVVGHAAVLAIAVLAARDTGGSMFWLLALFCALGMVANLLAWASVRSGKVVWDLGVLTLVASLPVLVVASTRPGGAVLLVLGGTCYFIDWLVFKNALRMISGR
ncbi:MAG: hypothetical protein H6529_08070 [Nocardioides sp.]|nr:hypothetical protein [Nocardioidaceae bacterium]MCB8956426.1 hypothetical protein [Nocardioides sp.]